MNTVSEMVPLVAAGGPINENIASDSVGTGIQHFGRRKAHNAQRSLARLKDTCSQDRIVLFPSLIVRFHGIG